MFSFLKVDDRSVPVAAAMRFRARPLPGCGCVQAARCCFDSCSALRALRLG
jgi:hypothetical protein